jgi:hypothetical protein
MAVDSEIEVIDGSLSTYVVAFESVPDFSTLLGLHTPSTAAVIAAAKQFAGGDETPLEAFDLSAPAIYRQLERLRNYVAKLSCKAIVVEPRYTDRDWVEDFSAFYSRSFRDYPNKCFRLSFFSCEPQDLVGRIESALKEVAEAPLEQDPRRLLRRKSFDLSKHFIGFAVVRPLNATPVGRTAVRPPEESSDVAIFDSVHTCTAHILGATFTVRALQFQQQDVGVGTCATSALWSSLQKLREHEEIAPSTPSKITTLASQFHLTFGRAMPSDGLSTNQMCVAIRALGASPSVTSARTFDATRAAIAVATRSGFCPVLVLKRPGHVGHAVAVAGLRLNESAKPFARKIRSFSDRVEGVYVHDDRVAPYCYSKLEKWRDGSAVITLPLHEGDGEAVWTISQLIIPVHVKIHLSVGTLHQVALTLAEVVARAWMEMTREATTPPVEIECWFRKSSVYVESLLLSQVAVSAEGVIDLSSQIRLPRYVGVVRFRLDHLRWIDVLVDSTSTDRHTQFLQVVAVNLASAEHVVFALSDFCHAAISHLRAEARPNAPEC